MQPLDFDDFDRGAHGPACPPHPPPWLLPENRLENECLSSPSEDEFRTLI